MIFDFDGVVVDSERYWAEVENDVFARIVPGWKYGDHVAITGMSHLDIHLFLNDTYGTDFSREEFEDIQNDIATGVYDRSRPMPDVIDYLERLSKHGVPIGIASSSRAVWIQAQLQRHGIDGYCSYLTTAEELGPGRGKPHPAIYELAAKKMNLPVDKCLVIEDSKHGITSAVGAGTYCIGLRTDMNDGQDLSAAAEIMTGFDEINVNERFEASEL